MENQCPTCMVMHTTSKNIGKCSICGRVICVNCKKYLDLYDACAVVTYENIVEMKNYSTENVVLCRRCYSQIEIVVNEYKAALIDLQTKFKSKFDDIRDEYLRKIAILLQKHRK